jgi:hypothetical protein
MVVVDERLGIARSLLMDDGRLRPRLLRLLHSSRGVVVEVNLSHKLGLLTSL